MDWGQIGKTFAGGFGQGALSGGQRQGGNGSQAGKVAGIIPKILKRRRYKTDMDTSPQTADPNDTGVPDYMSPQGSDPYDDKWGY